MGFERYFDDGSIAQLKEHSLFNDCLKADCLNGEVFPAIRKGEISFYYKGGKLFSFKNGAFTTHYKYASVIHGKPKNYISDTLLGEHRLIQNFSEGYARIKENCASYSGVEADGVSKLYKKFSSVASKSHVVMLDIEIAFSTSEEEDDPVRVVEQTPNSRIDFLCLDTKTGLLRFFEAKHYTNQEIRPGDGEPPLLKQLAKYDKVLATSKDEIIKAYENHVDAINKIFGTDIPVPREIDPEAKAVIFGFDTQERRDLKTGILSKDSPLYNRTYARGSMPPEVKDFLKLFQGECDVTGHQSW